MMVKDCPTLVRGCQWCHAFEGTISKVPLCPIQAHALLELIHMDFTSVESTMELNKPPCVKNVLIITNHFTHCALTVVTKDQIAKTVMRIFYERFIAVFGVPAKILSNCGANFTSTLVEELCATFSIQKCRTMAYHAQCNGQVERFHQTLFCMIGKLTSDKKAHSEQHLPELVQAYNSTWLAVTGYLPLYLMPMPPNRFLFSNNGPMCAPAMSPHMLLKSGSALRRPIQRPTHGPTTRLNSKSDIMTWLLVLCSSYQVT